MNAARVFEANRLPTSPGVCGWVALLPPRPGTPPLTEALTADVTVIGAGFAGLSAARRLSQLDPGLRVVVLEAGIVGNGPAGRNSGFIIDLPHDVSAEGYGGDQLRKSRDHITLQRRAVDFAKELAAAEELGRETLDPCGRYNLALTAEGDRHLAAYAAQLDRLGEPYSRLDAAAVGAVTGSRVFSSGLYMPGTVIVQPAAYIRAIADSLAPPVRVHEQTPATAIERRGGGWRVRTPKGSVESPRIVLANNGQAERFGFFRDQFLHVYTFASMTAPFDPARLGGQRA